MKVVKSRAFKDRLKGHKEAIIALCSPYAEGGYLLLSASKDGSIRAWDLVKRTITNRLLLAKQPGKTVKFANQENMTELEKRNETKKEEESLTKDQLTAAAFSETHVFAGFDDGLVCSWNLSNVAEQIYFEGHEKRVNEICVLKRRLVTGSTDCTIRVWGLGNGQCEVVFKMSSQVNKLRVSGDRLYALIQRCVFYELDLEKQAITKCVKFSENFSSFQVHEGVLYAGTIDNCFSSYSLAAVEADKKPQPLRRVEGLGGWVLEIKVLREYIYCGCDDMKIKVFRLADLHLEEEMAGHDDGVIAIEFADNMLYSGSYDNSIRSWDIREMVSRVRQRKMMVWEDLQSKKYDVFYKIAYKNKKKAPPKKK